MTKQERIAFAAGQLIAAAEHAASVLMVYRPDTSTCDRARQAVDKAVAQMKEALDSKD